jgi:hypothetical protein
MSRVTSDEVLEVQMATKACSLEDNLRAWGVDDDRTINVQHRAWWVGESSRVWLLCCTVVGLCVRDHLEIGEVDEPVKAAKAGEMNGGIDRSYIPHGSSIIAYI